MARYRVPDHLICLGKGGIEVGETFVKQDWILEEVLRDDPRNEAPDEDQNPLHAYFIDSDKSTLPSGIEDTVSQRVDRITDEYDIIRPPDVDATTINVVEGTHEQYLTPDEVTSDSTIQELATDLGLNAWWLQQGDNDILGPLDGLKRGGVDRKRGLTKAISRICEWEGDPLHKVERSVEGQNDAHVAMVVGLGGGTGSGLFLDLAKRIKEAGATVTLFGVLPTPSGRDDPTVLANAYATLSELEYLVLTSQNYFRNIVLLPYDPAIDDDIFDKAATYTITSYYNISGSQSNTYRYLDETEKDGPPKYAPFTVASSRYLHYLKEDFDRTKQNFDNYFENKKDALGAEEELYNELKSHLRDNHPNAAKELHTTDGSSSVRLPSGDATDLLTRLRNVKQLIDQDFIEEMEFRSVEQLSAAFERVENTAEDRATWEDEQDKESAVARTFVPLLARSVDNVDDYQPSDGDWAADEREFVTDVVIREFELVARRAGIIKAKEVLKSDGEANSHVATDIEHAISLNDYGDLAEIETEITDLKREVSTLEEELNALETLIDGGDTKVSEFKRSWKDAVEDPLEDIYDLFDQKLQIDDYLKELKDAINKEINGLEDANEADNIHISGTEFDSYSDLNDLLVDEGCDKVNDKHIEGTVKNVKKAKQKRLQAKEQAGTLSEKILSLLNQGTIDGLNSDYRGLTGDIDNQLVRMPEWSDDWDVTVETGYLDDRSESLDARESDLLDELERATERIVNEAKAARNPQDFLSADDSDAERVLKNFDFETAGTNANRVLDHLDTDKHDTVKNARSFDDLIRTLRDGPVEDLLSAILVKPFKDQKEALEEEREEVKSELKTYQKLDTIVTQKGGAYARAVDNVDSIHSIATFEEGGHSGPFKEDAEPYSRGVLGNTTHLGETPLWDEDKEKEELLSNLDNIVPELGGEHLPINEIHISDNETDQTTYEGFRLGTAFMSPLFDGFRDDEAGDIPSITDDLLDRRVLKKDDMVIGRGAFADSYDVVMMTFLTGVFLDDLSIFTNECRDAYTRGTDVVPNDNRHNHQDSVPSIVKNHNYGLDGVTYHEEGQFFPPASDGGFCYRRNILNFTTDGTSVLLDQADNPSENENGVVDALLQDYYEVVGYPSTVDIQ